MIDIIIPVYNTPLEDLERCFKSILDQTVTNYKVYIIDDGSNEKTKSFLDNYVKDKNNFIVKHIENDGVSNARNIGIEMSNSLYITFVDADDTLEKDFLKEAYNCITENNLDIVIGGYNEIKDNKVVRTRLSLPGLHIYEDTSKIYFFDKLLSSKTNETNKEIKDAPVGRIYTRLFKKDSIKNLRFSNDIHMSEDTLFMIDYTYQAKRIGIIDRVWYNYYINDYSISNGTNKELLVQRIKEFIKAIENRMDKETNLTLKKAYQARINKSNNYINEIKNTNN